MIELIEEQHAALLRLKPDLEVISVHSQALRGKGSVADRLHRLADEMKAPHVVVLTTHESFLEIDTRRFAGWRLRIDEIPQGVASSHLLWSRVGHLLPGMFDIAPIMGTEWGRLVAKPGALDKRRRGPCPLAEAAPDFRRFAGRPQDLIIKAQTWKAAAAAPEIAWASVWSFEAVRPFADVLIASAGVDANLTMKAALALKPGDLTITTTSLGVPRTAQPTIRIGYFTSGHQGSTTYWNTSEGRRCLVAIADYMREHVPGLGFWGANDGVWQLLEHRLHGEHIGPRVIGINRLRHERSCALIYSSKATPGDGPLQAFLDLDDAAFRSAREDEDIRQFVSRGAIRDPAYGGAYDVHLYSLDQAERLAVWLAECGFHHVDPVPLDAAGIMAVQRTRPKLVKDPEIVVAERRAGATERKRRQRKRDKAGQTAKPRGRPTRPKPMDNDVQKPTSP